tara:strand:- start:97 stop:741 length:645 start_codon:yes stop_codon:yes gene_type:complete
MTLQELKTKCSKMGWDINKITYDPLKTGKFQRAYRTRHKGKGGKYIYATYMRKKCAICKKETMKCTSTYLRSNYKRQRSFCSHKCRVIGVSGENNYLFEEGRIMDNKNSDYIQIKTMKHPYRTKGNYVVQHRWIMEKHIGRYLKPNINGKPGSGELVHHVDMNKKNNDINNLYLCKNMADHQRVHGSFNELCRILMENNIIAFDHNIGEYCIVN